MDQRSGLRAAWFREPNLLIRRFCSIAEIELEFWRHKRLTEAFSARMYPQRGFQEFVISHQTIRDFFFFALIPFFTF